MQFNSLSYVFIFLPFVVGGWALLRKTPYANAFILAASVYFYASAQLWYLAPLFVTAMLDYYVGQQVHATEDPRRRKWLTAASIVANLLLLGYFKYAGWITTKIAAAGMAVGLALPIVHVGLPPAISFYTFQSMSYTIDIYRRELKPYRSVVDYLSFVTFFPHLVAGPIMRARDLLPQLARNRALPSLALVSQGLFMILLGLWQKTVVADHFGGIVEDITAIAAKRQPLAPGLGLIFAYAFALQIYADFSAYTTIARGSAKLLNVELMRNFLAPYLSTNPSEFWQRWHISLSTWLRDYLYIPLGGNRGGAVATYRNLMLTMVLGGLWHGAGFLFLLWGIWHGLLLVFYRLVPIDRWLLRLGLAGRVLATLIFFHLICIGWIFFRGTTSNVLSIFKSILATPQAFLGAPADGPTLLQYGWVFLVVAGPMIVMDLITRLKNAEIGDLFPAFPTALKVALSLFLFYGIIFLGRRQGGEFIYFAF